MHLYFFTPLYFTKVHILFTERRLPEVIIIIPVPDENVLLLTVIMQCYGGPRRY